MKCSKKPVSELNSGAIGSNRIQKDDCGRGMENGPWVGREKLEEKLRGHSGGDCGWPVKHDRGLLRHSGGRGAGKTAMGAGF